MIVELVTAILLLNYLPKGVSAAWVWAALVLLVVAWLSTAFLQVPCHSKLNIAFDADVHRRLVNSNWIRTISWTLRGLLVAVRVRIERVTYMKFSAFVILLVSHPSGTTCDLADARHPNSTRKSS